MLGVLCVPGAAGVPSSVNWIRTCMGHFPVKWLFSVLCQFFGSEREGAVLHPVAYDQVPGARGMGSRDRNASKAWRRGA